MIWLQMMVSAGLAFLVTYIAGIFFVPYMRRKKLGQSILEVGPKWHMTKQGTPTMGGVMFVLGIAAAILLAGVQIFRDGDRLHLILFLFALMFALIGFLDDYVKVAKKRNLGLTAPQKLVLQIAVSFAFVTLLRTLGVLSPNLFIPFINITIPLPWIWYMVLSVLVIVGEVNAVNFTDGVDGLLSSVTLPILVFFMTAAWIKGSPGVGIVAAGGVGALIAFLIYNFNPAKIFMGDTGSLFLGGLVCGLAFALNIPLFLPIVGFIYLAEILSVVLQVLYFKATKGKRLFKMAPIHHHFEMTGWGEKKICAAFGLITLLACMLSTVALFGLYWT